MEKIRQELKRVSWKNVWLVFVIGFVGYTIGVISTMYFTSKYINQFIRANL